MKITKDSLELEVGETTEIEIPNTLELDAQLVSWSVKCPGTPTITLDGHPEFVSLKVDEGKTYLKTDPKNTADVGVYTFFVNQIGGTFTER
jgi:hypothetical protein